MSARSELAALLTANLLPASQYVVMPYAREVDPPAKSTVMVRTDSAKPGPAIGLTTYGFALVLIAAKTEAGAGDDELDALLEDVIFALDQLSPAGITWSQATRATYQESNPAYEVAVEVTVKKEN